MIRYVVFLTCNVQVLISLSLKDSDGGDGDSSEKSRRKTVMVSAESSYPLAEWED